MRADRLRFIDILPRPFASAMTSSGRTKLAAVVGSTIWWSLFAALALWITLHYLLVQLSNMPMSPLRADLQPIITSYVSPYFTQNWSFFAPTPVSSDVALMVRGRYADTRSAKPRIGPWYDISETLFNALRENRLTPLSTIELMVSNALIDYNNTVHLSPSARTRSHGKIYIIDPLPANLAPLDYQILKRFAASVLLGAETKRPIQIQLALRLHQFPRFTKRAKVDNATGGTLLRIQWEKMPSVEAFQ